MSKGDSPENLKKPNPATLKRVSQLFAQHRPQLILIAVLVLLSAAIGLLPPFLLQGIVDKGISQKDMEVITRLSIYTLLATLGSTALSMLFGYLSVLVGQQIMKDLRVKLFDHLQGMPLKFFTGTRTGEIQSRLTNDVAGVQSVVSDTVANVLSNLVTVLSTLVAMFILDWRLTLLSVGVMPLLAFVGKKVGDVLREVRKTSQEQLADLNSVVSESISVSGALLMKTSGRQEQALARFDKTNAALTKTNVKMAMIFRSFGALFGLAFAATPVLVYWLAGYLAVGQGDARITLGTIVAFTALQARMFFPLTGLMNVQVELMSSMALFDRIYEYLDMEQEIQDRPNAVDLPHIDGRVEFEDVTFRYESTQETPTLQGISLRAEPGQLVALVGPSGAGKTTLSYLIARLYDVESGSVRIDGHDVRDIQLACLGRNIGVVTQEAYLVHDTIRENLRYGNPDANDAQLEEAARAAAIHEHIQGLPEGYDTVVGERGYKLSGGEKQRISIARAILKDPRILILDEATSSLDTTSERLVQEALDRLMPGRTTFAIAHRLSTIRAADQILVVEGGRIAERGTHEVLLEQDGAYARLYRAQFGGDSMGVSAPEVNA